MNHIKHMDITVGGRKSPLSQAQVKEVLNEIRKNHPLVNFSCLFVETIGDKDQKTSLRTLEKSNFFTKEIDEMLLSGICRVAIHSGKDLPDPIPKGLAIVAITRGVDSADVLVMRDGETVEGMLSGAVIATSSVRREEAVKELRDDLRFVDLRGTIGQRLSRLENGETDGVVVAEAALIRLGLTHLNRVKLPGDTVALQGQLAIVCREDDVEMKDLFRCMDCRSDLNHREHREHREKT